MFGSAPLRLVHTLRHVLVFLPFVVRSFQLPVLRHIVSYRVVVQQASFYYVPARNSLELHQIAITIIFYYWLGRLQLTGEKFVPLLVGTAARGLPC